MNIYYGQNFRESSFYPYLLEDGKMPSEDVLAKLGTEYAKVGEVDTTDLERAYFLCQNGLGHENPLGKQRSMSVGDIAEINGAYYIVMPAGFQKLNTEDAV